MRVLSLFVGAAAVASVVAAPATSTQKSKRAVFTWAGVNESGAEFGSGSIPGQLGKDYIWPVHSTIDTLVGKGFNIFRIPILMERIVPTKMTGSVNSTYLSGLQDIVSYVTGKGAYAIIDPHNFGRYYGSVMSSTSDFQTFWTTVAKNFASNSKVIFDTNNEYHDMDNTVVANLNQAAINGIRAAGATSQYIFVEGNSYSGAWTWVSSGTSTGMGGLTDPKDSSGSKIIYEMHQYLDSDGSGTSATCVSSTIGSQRLAAATAWLKSNKKKAILGETAGGANSVCIAALKDMFAYMKTNSDVWDGFLLWGGGPWWGTYIYGMEPPSGTAYVGVLPSILSYV